MSRNIRNAFRKFRLGVRLKLLQKKSASLVKQVKNALTVCGEDIPVIVISYNNGAYVMNITRQLNNFGVKPIIIDNNSSCNNTQSILNDISQQGMGYIAKSNHNFGHLVGFIEPVYSLLPEVFAYTDPDLQFNKNLPKDFLSRLADLIRKVPVYKAGFALALDIEEKIKDTTIHLRNSKPFYFEKVYSIREFESKYWIKRLQHEKLEIYAAPIDTTFAVYRKQNYSGDFLDAVRVAGDFSAIHLPWFNELDIFTEEDRAAYSKQNISSNW